MTFHGGATKFDSLLMEYKTSGRKNFCPYKWSEHSDKMQSTEFPQFDAFYSELRSRNPIEQEYMDYVYLLKSGLTKEQAIIRLQLSERHPLLYQYLQQMWMQKQMSSFKEFLHWYSIEDVVRT